MGYLKKKMVSPCGIRQDVLNSKEFGRNLKPGHP